MKSPYLLISLRIALTFAALILLSYLGDTAPARQFFGDAYCTGLHYDSGHCRFGYNPGHGEMWHWGLRHVLCFSAGVVLGISHIVLCMRDFEKLMLSK